MSNSIWPDGEQTARLLAGAREGNSEAIDALLARHRDSLRRLVDLRMDQQIKQRIDASDVVQDVLVEANRRLQDYLRNPSIAFHLWIRQIAKDRIIDAHRRHRVSAKRSVDCEQVLATHGAFDQSSLDLVSQLRDRQLTPAAQAAQREIVIQVDQAVHRLDEHDREMILMRHYEQLSNQEIAQALGLSEPASSMRYLRALKRLRALMENDGSGEPAES